MTSAGIARVRACFENPIDVYPAGGRPRSHLRLAAAKSPDCRFRKATNVGFATVIGIPSEFTGCLSEQVARHRACKFRLRMIRHLTVFWRIRYS